MLLLQIILYTVKIEKLLVHQRKITEKEASKISVESCRISSIQCNISYNVTSILHFLLMHSWSYQTNHLKINKSANVCEVHESNKCTLVLILSFLLKHYIQEMQLPEEGNHLLILPKPIYIDRWIEDIME